MLETIDLGRRIEKEAYEASFPPLRDRLDDLQRAVFEAKIPVCIVFEGWDAAGKGDSIEKLVGRLDPRGYRVYPTYAPDADEAMRPFLWRFWTRIPGRGEIVIFDRSWYHRLLQEHVEGDLSRKEWQSAFGEITQFERMLADDGMVMVKLWLHISEKEQRRRFKALEQSKYEHWKVSKDDWKAHKRYEEYLEAAEVMLERTSSAHAPWTIVESSDKYFRRIKVVKTIIDAVQTALDRKSAPAEPAARAPRSSVAVPALRELPTLLDEVDLSRSLEEEAYEAQLEKYQARLRELQFECYDRRTPVVIACEGWDAAGKGGSIKRLSGSLDPRGYNVVPIAAPKGDEATHHYLWRFWRQLPKAGHWTIFDRTWYGRVLVERVEGFAREEEWRRAYQEIREFELSLANYGTVLVKLWFHISPEMQLQRFREREATEHKRYKITAEDWRNREKHEAYRAAVTEMIAGTSTTYAPWTIVEANDKLWARIKVMTTIAEAVARGLKKSRRR